MSKPILKKPLSAWSQYQAEVERQGLTKLAWGLIYLAGYLPRKLDFASRTWDFWRHRSYGGSLERIGIYGHSPIALLLPIFVLYYIFFGPSGGEWKSSGYFLATAVASVGLLACRLWRKWQRKNEGKRVRMDSISPLMVALGLLVLLCYGRGWELKVGFLGSVLVLWGVLWLASRKDGPDSAGERRWMSLRVGAPKLALIAGFVCLIVWAAGTDPNWIAIRPQLIAMAVLGAVLVIAWRWFRISPPILTLSAGLAILVHFYLLQAAGWPGAMPYLKFAGGFGLFTLIGWIAFRIQHSKNPQRFGCPCLWAQLGILMGAGLFVWILADGSLKEYGSGIYRHVYIPLTVAMLVIPLSLGSVLARIIVRRRIVMVGSKFHHLLERVELFAWPPPPPVNWNKVLRSLAITARHPLMALYPPSLVILLAPFVLRSAFLPIWLLVLGLSIVFLAFTNIHSRLWHLNSIYRSLFFQGMQSVVSVIVIVLGVTRLADVGYVSYVVEASPRTLLAFIFASYALLWFFEYWMNRNISEEFLALLNPGQKASSRVPFEYVCHDVFRTRVLPQDRVLQIHEGNKLLAVGKRDWGYRPRFLPAPEALPKDQESSIFLAPVDGKIHCCGIMNANGREVPSDVTKLDELLNEDSVFASRLRSLCDVGGEPTEEVNEQLLKLIEDSMILGTKVLWRPREFAGRGGPPTEDWEHERYQFFDRFELLDHLIDHASLADFDFENKMTEDKGIASAEIRHKLHGERNQLRMHVKDLRRQFLGYYTILNVAIAAGLFFHVAGMVKAPDPTAVEVAADAETMEGTFDLRQELFELPNHEGKPRDAVVLMAASGGGTRAALYTASVLHGLDEIGRLHDVVLASGVSGGGAALAYFAGKRDLLLKTEGATEAWRAFYQALSDDFIVRCLRGSCEWRIAGGNRLGHLLDEGFQDSFFKETRVNSRRLPTGSPDPELPTIGDAKLGVLFNVAVLGEAHQTGSVDVEFSTWVQQNGALAKSWARGTRLVFTNVSQMRDVQSMDWQSKEKIDRLGLRYTTILDPSVPLSSAAALNANFPPVFSNAAVDVGKHRYWVTDGGSVDNRGVISLLYALRKSLTEQLDVRDQPTRTYNYPKIHIIVADASGIGIDYSENRGLGAIFGSATKLASGLIQELTREVNALYEKLHGQQGEHKMLTVHHLTMPLALRSRGGLGTHWMMPLMAEFQSCQNEDASRDESRVLTRNQILRAIARLHQPQANYEDIDKLLPDDDPNPLRRFAKPGTLEEVRNWYSPDAAYAKDIEFTDKEAQDHPSAWQAIVAALSKDLPSSGGVQK